MHLSLYDRAGCLCFISSQKKRQVLEWPGFYLHMPPSIAIPICLTYQLTRPIISFESLRTYSLKQLYVLSHVLSESYVSDAKPSVSVDLLFNFIGDANLQPLEIVLRFLFLSKLYRFKCLLNDLSGVREKFSAIYPGDFPFFSCGSIWLNDIDKTVSLQDSSRESTKVYHSHDQFSSALAELASTGVSVEKLALMQRARYVLNNFISETGVLYAYTEVLLLCEIAVKKWPELARVLRKGVGFFLSDAQEATAVLLGEISALSRRVEAFNSYMQDISYVLTIDQPSSYPSEDILVQYLNDLQNNVVSASDVHGDGLEVGTERQLAVLLGSDFYQKNLQLLSGRRASAQLRLIRQRCVDGQANAINDSLNDFCELINVLKPSIIPNVFPELLSFDWLHSVGPAIEDLERVFIQIYNRCLAGNHVKQSLCFYLLVKPLYEKFGNGIVGNYFKNIINAQNFKELSQTPGLSKIISESTIGLMLFRNGIVEAFNQVLSLVDGCDAPVFLRPIVSYMKGREVVSDEVKTLLISCCVLLRDVPASFATVQSYIDLGCHRFEAIHRLAELVAEELREAYLVKVVSMKGLCSFDYLRCDELLSSDDAKLDFASNHSKNFFQEGYAGQQDLREVSAARACEGEPQHDSAPVGGSPIGRLMFEQLNVGELKSDQLRGSASSQQSSALSPGRGASSESSAGGSSGFKCYSPQSGSPSSRQTMFADNGAASDAKTESCISVVTS